VRESAADLRESCASSGSAAAACTAYIAGAADALAGAPDGVCLPRDLRGDQLAAVVRSYLAAHAGDAAPAAAIVGDALRQAWPCGPAKPR
jgi:hypothetical protein